MRRALCLLALSALATIPAAAQQREALGTPSATLTPAIRVGNMVYASGQLGTQRNAEDQSITGQTRRALERTKAVFEMAGTTMENAVRCTVWLVEASDFQAMNAVWREFWPTSPPARSTLVIKALVVPGALIEVECMAVMPTQ
jgi:2-iminobutanoate/2-iminopropanoate deaminase